ncbi:MAG: TolC family protein [Candidatus Aminicenantes bacterium]|nr:MAG: TolC family protein [Candidatus Aminicenantes bacterium]
MKKILILVVFLLAFHIYGMCTESYNLQEFLLLVEQYSKDLQLAEKELDMAKARKREAISQALPELSANGSYNRNLGRNFLYIDLPDFETGETREQKFQISYWNEFGFSLSLRQTLFSFKVGNALKAAKQYQKLTDFVYDSQYQTVIGFAKKAFYQTLLLKKVWEVTKASEENARDNYQMVKKKYDNGLASKFELLQAETRWENLKPETMKARRNYELALNNLKNFAGIPVQEEISLEGDFNGRPPMPDIVQFEKILEMRPDYNALLWEQRLRGTDVKAQASEYYPTLKANFVLYNMRALSDKFKLERKNVNYWIGLTLSIPIFNGGFTSAQVNKAKIELEKTRIKIDKTKEAIYNEIRNIYLRLEESQKRISSSEKSVKTAEQAFKIAESSTASGLATQLELKDTRLLFDQAKVNYYSAVYDYLAAYFDWELAAGLVKK